MPNNKVKTSKQLKGKVKSSTLHPGSRRAKQVERINLRTDKLALKKRDRNAQHSITLDKSIFFVHCLTPDKPCCTLEDIHEYLVQYLARNDREIEEEEKARWKGRARTARHEKLEQQKYKECAEADEGIVVPNLLSEELVEKFRRWLNDLHGDANYLPQLKFLRISRKNKDQMIDCENDDEQMQDS